jgi:hypothetical protein
MRACGRLGVVVVAMLAAATASAAAADSAVADGMKQYVDSAHGFSFWYPGDLQIAAATTHDSTSFPGGVVVETLQVGEAGEVTVSVVNSPKHTITDEPNGHAAPIAQTKYVYDASARRWMVSYPEGIGDGKPGTTGPADVSTKTIGGLPMLPSGARFDTTIIPLSTTRFVVVQDGGGSAFTEQLASTVAPAGARVDAAKQSVALRAEAAAYKKQQ